MERHIDPSPRGSRLNTHLGHARLYLTIGLAYLGHAWATNHDLVFHGVLAVAYLLLATLKAKSQRKAGQPT